MVTVLRPWNKHERITYHLPEFRNSFPPLYPPKKESTDDKFGKATRNFFLDYRKDVLSKYMPPMYKWGDQYSLYSPHPQLIHTHRKQRWEHMHQIPNVRLTFKDQIKIKEIEDFYLLCQFHRQYCNDYTGHLHPLDYFEYDTYRWCDSPKFNDTYTKYPALHVKYKHPLTLPLTDGKAWIEPFEPFRRMIGKRDPYPNIKYDR